MTSLAQTLRGGAPRRQGNNGRIPHPVGSAAVLLGGGALAIAAASRHGLFKKESERQNPVFLLFSDDDIEPRTSHDVSADCFLADWEVLSSNTSAASTSPERIEIVPQWDTMHHGCTATQVAQHVNSLWARIQTACRSRQNKRRNAEIMAKFASPAKIMGEACIELFFRFKVKKPIAMGLTIRDGQKTITLNMYFQCTPPIKKLNRIRYVMRGRGGGNNTTITANDKSMETIINKFAKEMGFIATHNQIRSLQSVDGKCQIVRSATND